MHDHIGLTRTVAHLELERAVRAYHLEHWVRVEVAAQVGGVEELWDKISSRTLFAPCP